MSDFPILAAVAIVFATALLIKLYFNFITPGLQDIPGPFLAKYSNLWRLAATWKGHFARTLQDHHRRHGDIVRTGPKLSVLRIQNAIESIYGVKAVLPKVRSDIVL